jgi:hypothetical protein
MKKKLNLKRETLVALQSDALDDIHGGNQQSGVSQSVSISLPSRNGCPPTQTKFLCPSTPSLLSMVP